MSLKYDNNDIKLEVWETSFWLTLFSISFSFTKKKSPNKHIKFIYNLMYVIPCKQYRKLFECAITNMPLTVYIVKDKIEFSKWVYTIMKLIHTTLKMNFIYNYEELENYFLNGPGLNTDYWGFFLWRFMHSVSFGFDGESRREYYSFFKNLKHIIICIYCKKSYKKFIEHDNDVILTHNIVQNKNTLTKWLYDLHNKVNQKLNKEITLSYEDVCNFFKYI